MSTFSQEPVALLSFNGLHVPGVDHVDRIGDSPAGVSDAQGADGGGVCGPAVGPRLDRTPAMRIVAMRRPRRAPPNIK